VADICELNEMDDIYVMLGAFGVFMVALWAVWMRLFSLEMEKSRASNQLPDVVDALSQILENFEHQAVPSLDNLEDKIADLIQDIMSDTMKNMEMPSAMDHIFGAVSNILQHKMMNSVPPQIADLIPPLNEDVAGSDVHGPPQN